MQAFTLQAAGGGTWRSLASCYASIAAACAKVGAVALSTGSHTLQRPMTHKFEVLRDVRDLRSSHAVCSQAAHGRHGYMSVAVASASPNTLQGTSALTLGSRMAARAASDTAGTPAQSDMAQGAAVHPSFPSVEEGGIIMGTIHKLPEVMVQEEYRKLGNAAVFDQEYQYEPRRTGRKQLAKMLKGDFVADYYLDKNKDPLMVNVPGAEQAVIRGERNERGFKRRRPQKKTPEALKASAKKKKK